MIADWVWRTLLLFLLFQFFSLLASAEITTSGINCPLSFLATYVFQLSFLRQGLPQLASALRSFEHEISQTVSCNFVFCHQVVLQTASQLEISCTKCTFLQCVQLLHMNLQTPSTSEWLFADLANSNFSIQTHNNFRICFFGLSLKRSRNKNPADSLLAIRNFFTMSTEGAKTIAESTVRVTAEKRFWLAGNCTRMTVFFTHWSWFGHFFENFGRRAVCIASWLAMLSVSWNGRNLETRALQIRVQRCNWYSSEATGHGGADQTGAARRNVSHHFQQFRSSDTERHAQLFTRSIVTFRTQNNSHSAATN